MSNCCANSASVLSPFTAAKATFALKAGVWFRRGRLDMVLLLIRGDLRRCQAEIPLIPLFRFAEPAFRSWVAMRLSRHWLRSTPISRVQRAWPSGGLEQTVATSRASSLPESLRLAPGRGSSLSAASRLLTTKRRLVRYTVEPPTTTLEGKPRGGPDRDA